MFKPGMRGMLCVGLYNRCIQVDKEVSPVLDVVRWECQDGTSMYKISYIKVNHRKVMRVKGQRLLGQVHKLSWPGTYQNINVRFLL